MVGSISTIQTERHQTSVGHARRFILSVADRKFLIIALFALLAVRLLAVFWLPFADSTEARYAEIARKMLETGDWITPQFDYGVPFWGKPPLHTWLSALGMKIFGVGPFGARILILATSLGILSLIFNWVRRHSGSDQALVAVVVLASTCMFFGASAFVMTDIAMVLGTTLSMVGFYNCITGGASRALWGRLFFVGIAIGLLAKGPVALVMTGIPIVPWLIMTGNWRRLSAIPWVSGLAIAAVLTLPWYIAAEIKTPGFLRYFIIGEHYERFVVSGWEGDLYGSGHARPKGIIWFYWLLVFLPWTFFTAALLPRLKSALKSDETRSEGWHSYLALWAISPLLLFTPAANLLPAYVLPGLPAAAVLLVSLWAAGWGTGGRWTRIAVVAAIGSLVSIFTLLTVLSFLFPATLTIKTEREMIAAAKAADTDINVTYWGNRSYSAEFYMRGDVQFTAQTSDFDALATNGVRDAVVISQSEAAEIAPLLGPNFERIGEFGRRVLFVENLTNGEAS